MRTIHKEPVHFGRGVAVELPAGAKILTVQVQGAMPCIWFECESENEKTTRVFDWAATGEEINPDYRGDYVGSVQSPQIIKQRTGAVIPAGTSVYHLFERKVE